VQANLIQNQDTENANLRRTIEGFDTTEAVTERERVLAQKMVEMQAKITKHEEDNKTLRKDNFDKTNKLRELQANLDQSNTTHREDISISQQRESRLNAEHAETARKLEQRILQLQTADVKELTQRLKTTTADKNALQLRINDQLDASPESTRYETLLAMAMCMNKMGKEEKDTGSLLRQFEPKPSFQDHVNKVVKRCLEGSGLNVREVGERQTEVFRLLNTVYVAGAQRGEHVDFVTTTKGKMVKSAGGEKKRRFDEFGRPF
jgi:hypothetical protein